MTRVVLSWARAQGSVGRVGALWPDGILGVPLGGAPGPLGTADQTLQGEPSILSKAASSTCLPISCAEVQTEGGPSQELGNRQGQSWLCCKGGEVLFQTYLASSYGTFPPLHLLM